MAQPTVSNIFSLTTKRVTDLVLEQSRDAFRATGIKLDAKMSSIVTLIHQQGPLSSTTLAAETGLSRQLVESRLRRLVADGYLSEEKDSADLRRRVYSIRQENTGDAACVIEALAGLEDIYDTLWAELGVDLHQGLRELEALLEKRPISARLNEQNQGDHHE